MAFSTAHEWWRRNEGYDTPWGKCRGRAMYPPVTHFVNPGCEMVSRKSISIEEPRMPKSLKPPTHLKGSSASVTSEAEKHLLCPLPGGWCKNKIFKVESKRRVPKHDNLEGGGCDLIIDVESEAHGDAKFSSRAGHDDFDHLRGAGIHTIVQLTPRNQGILVEHDRQQLAGLEWKWWESQDDGCPSTTCPGWECRYSDQSTRSGDSYGARTPPRSITPCSNTPYSEILGDQGKFARIPLNLTQQSSSPGRRNSMTPRRATPRSSTPRSSTPRSSARRSSNWSGD